MTVTHSRRKLLRRSLLSAAVLAALFGGAVWYRHSVQTAAETEASEFVTINGSIGLDYRDNPLSRLLAVLPGTANMKRLGGQHVIAASFPRDRMTNHMVQQLLNFRDLEIIALYPPDPGESGIDFNASSATTVKSLRDLDLPLSEKSIALIEERFPNLQIRVMQRPGNNGMTEGEDTATE